MAETEDKSTEAPMSIEAIAAEYNLGQEKQAPKPEPQSVQEAPSFKAPDPVTDTEGFSKWAENEHKQNAELRTSLSQTLEELNAEKQRIALEREEQELNALVGSVAKQLDGVPEKLVKYALADRYNSDKAFQAILDNRNTAPKALERAIAALMPELRKDFSIKPDPQIAENQRAMSEGTRGASAAQSDPSDRTMELINAPLSTFDREWEKIKSGG